MQYDLIVIGGGSGGVRAARTYAATGAKVALIECDKLGGTCVNVGCVPKKLLVYAGEYAKHFNDSIGYGFDIDSQHISFNWAKLIEAKNKEIHRLNGIYQSLLASAGVEIIKGRGQIISDHEVMIEDAHVHKILSAQNILIAVGGKPFVPTIEGHQFIRNSNDMFFLKKLPKTIFIIGGGYIAVEFASIFKNLGVDVTLAYRSDLFLRDFDNDIRHHLANQMELAGIHLLFNHNPQSIIENPNKSGYLIQTIDKNNQPHLHPTELVFFATGRIPMTENLGLDKIGVEMDKKGAIRVNDCYQTNIPHIYAIGDVIDRVALTPVAIHEAMMVNQILQGRNPEALKYNLIPSAVFSHPPIATVGLTELKAIQQYGLGDVVIYKSEFRAMKQILTGGHERCFIKLVVQKSTDKILGLHMIGSEAGEIMQGFAVAIQMGATKHDFDQTVGIHPTLAEEIVTLRSSIPASV